MKIIAVIIFLVTIIVILYLSNRVTVDIDYSRQRVYYIYGGNIVHSFGFNFDGMDPEELSKRIKENKIIAVRRVDNIKKLNKLI